jgi:hypothetical protein
MQATRLLDLRDVSLTTIQACVLLGCYAISEGEASAEAMYYSVACRMAMVLDLARAPSPTRLEREVRIRGQSRYFNGYISIVLMEHSLVDSLYDRCLVICGCPLTAVDPFC